MNIIHSSSVLMYNMFDGSLNNNKTGFACFEVHNEFTTNSNGH